MAQEIRILMVEDTALDAELIEHEFKKENLSFQLKRVETKEAFEQALLGFGPDIILSDMMLPAFHGLSALAIAKEKYPHVPFIFVSGTIGDELAVSSVKMGATDYVLKDSLSKIVPATLRALKEFKQNLQLKEIENLKDFIAAVVESTSDAIIGVDLEGKVTSWNTGAQMIYGYTAKEILGKNVLTIYTPEDFELYHIIIAKIQNGESVIDFQTKRVNKHGQVIDVSATVSPVKDAGGKVIGISSITRDITALIKMQSELEKQRQSLIDSEERFRQLTENIKEVIWLTDPAFSKILYINSAYTEIFGRSRGEIYANSMSFMEAVHVDDRQRVKDALEVQRTNFKFEVEYRIVKPDGDIRWVMARAFPIKDAEGKVYRMAGIAEDITRQKESEMALKQAHRQLIHTEKLAAIGQLSAGIAHEIKNPLGIITLCIEQLRDEVQGLNEGNKTLIEMIQEATDRANKVVVELLNYSRTSELKLSSVPVEVCLDHTVFLLQNAIKLKNITIHCFYTKEETFKVMGDRSLLEQAFFNLIANAIDAIEEKGSIHISTYLDISNKSGNKVMIEIADTGCGMLPEVAKRIFEPFYTTKPQGKGTGLGLSIVEMIVSQHHGTVWAESKVGAGTKFFIALPQLKGN